jgi:hypothetical protein
MTVNEKKLIFDVLDKVENTVVMAVAMRSAIELGTPIKEMHQRLERLQIPMDWSRLLEADLGNFAHDIGGIEAYEDGFGNLTSCFLPRFVKHGGSANA